LLSEEKYPPNRAAHCLSQDIVLVPVPILVFVLVLVLVVMWDNSEEVSVRSCFAGAGSHLFTFYMYLHVSERASEWCD